MACPFGFAGKLDNACGEYQQFEGAEDEDVAPTEEGEKISKPKKGKAGDKASVDLFGDTRTRLFSRENAALGAPCLLLLLIIIINRPGVGATLRHHCLLLASNLRGAWFRCCRTVSASTLRRTRSGEFSQRDSCCSHGRGQLVVHPAPLPPLPPYQLVLPEPNQVRGGLPGQEG